MPLAFPCALSLPTSTSHNSFLFGFRGGFIWEAFPDPRAGLGTSSCFHRPPRSPFVTLISLCGPFWGGGVGEEKGANIGPKARGPQGTHDHAECEA